MSPIEQAERAKKMGIERETFLPRAEREIPVLLSRFDKEVDKFNCISRRDAERCEKNMRLRAMGL